MRKLQSLLPGIGLALALCLLPSCLYADVKVPLDTDLDEDTLGNRTGSAHYVNILNLVAWGDAGLQAAASNGGITTLRAADTEFFNILGVYQKSTTVVYGD